MKNEFLKADMPHPVCLTDAHYRYGSYCRGDLREDMILYRVVSYAGLELLMAPGMILAQDAWEKRHRECLNPAEREAYLSGLQEWLKAEAEDDVFYESLYETALSLRRQVFGQTLDELFLQDAAWRDPVWEQIDFEQSDRLEKLIREKRCVLFLLQDARFAERMREDLRTIREQGLQIYAAVSDSDNGCFPSETLLRKLFPDEPLRTARCEGPLSQMESDEELARNAEQGDVFLLYYGEKGLTDCRNLSVPAYIRCVPESLVGKALSGQFSSRGQCGIAVPPHFDILPWVPMWKRTLASYRQFAFLSEQEGEDCYHLSCEELYRRWPEIFFSVYEERETGFPRGIAWPGQSMRPDDWYADFCARRDAALAGLINEIPGVQTLGGWFSLDGWKEKPVPWTAGEHEEGILVHGFLIDRPVNARVILSEGEPISPRRLAAETDENTIDLMLNYLFFLTPRLAGLYNHFREGRPREQTHLPCGHLDYLLREEDGRRMETFPLYRKACMALKDDGTFAFFHFRLGGGSCVIGGQTIRWEAGNVDPEKPGDIAVWTPLSSSPDAGASKMTYVKAVGENRVNLVILQNRLLCARDGDVLLPCMGVVISLEREAGLQFLRNASLDSLDAQGYAILDSAPEVRIQLDPPEGFDREQWSGIRWACGGGLTLIHEGKSCFSSEEASAESLAWEGWSSPLSAQTQESDIAAIMRHPRTAIGLTHSGHLFALVFSGRSAVSVGASYPEMCALAQKLVPDVWELMNVDGGGSSVLGVVVDRRFIEYSWPSTTPGTPAGLVRPIYSLFSVQVR